MVAERTRSTVRDVRRDNRSVLLWSLFFRQPCSRQDLGWATSLSPASVSNVVRELIGEGMVEEAGSVDSDGGRPRALLRMAPGYGSIIGVDVGETRVRVEMFDMTMAVLARAEYCLDFRDHGFDLVADRVRAGLASVLADSGCDPSAILGAGIGVPGAVEGDGAQALVYAQAYGWDAVPLGRLLAPADDFPLFIDNGAKMMGQAEMWFGAAQGRRQAVVCLMGSGLGASIVSGTPGLGGTSAAIEWGHTTVEMGGRPCRCGSRGCLEAYVGAEAILERYGRPLGSGEGTRRRDRRAGRRGPRRDRALPGRRNLRPGEPVRAGAHRPRGLGWPAAWRADLARRARGGQAALADAPVRAYLHRAGRAWPRRGRARCRDAADGALPQRRPCRAVARPRGGLGAR